MLLSITLTSEFFILLYRIFHKKSINTEPFLRQTDKSKNFRQKSKKTFKKLLTNARLCGIISFVQYGTPKCWCGSMAEQLICNQQVVGSTPITSSNMGDFPSGQRGQTVNLLSLTSVVRIHLPPPKKRALCNAQGSFCNEAFPCGNIKQPSVMKTLTLMKCAYGTIRNDLLHKFAKRICIMAAKPPLHICVANASF